MLKDIIHDVTRYYANLFDEADVQAPQLGQLQWDGKTEKVYKFVKNGAGAALVAGYNVTYDFSGGLRTTVKKPATGDLHLYAGVALSAIPDTQYGWIQIEGLSDTVLVDGTTDVAAYESLKPTNGQWHLIKDGAVDVGPAYANFAIAQAARTANSAANVAAWICATRIK